MSERVRLPFGSKVHPDDQGALIVGDTSLSIIPSATLRAELPEHHPGLLEKLARLVGVERPYLEFDLAESAIAFDGRVLHIHAGDFQKDLEAGRDGFSAAEASAFMTIFQDARANRLKSRS